MRYNPITNELFTENNEILKKLSCPLHKQWAELISTTSLKGKTCQECSKIVYDTLLFTDEELLGLLKKDADSCLKVDINQSNLTVTYHTNEQ